MVLNIKEISTSEFEFQMFVMDEHANLLIEKGIDVIKLTIGVSELKPSVNALKVMAESLYNIDKTRLVYPQGLPDLRKAIANYYNEQYNAPVNFNNVIIGCGSSSIYRNLCQLLCKPGQKILLPRPYYSMYLFSAILAGVELTYYDISCETKRIDFASFEKAYEPDKTAIVVFNSPGNPLGNVISKEEIMQANGIIAGRSFIVHDEIYSNTMFYGKYESPLGYLDTFRDVQIIINAFSKGFRMYTKRVGFAILPDYLIMPMRIIQQHTLLTIDPVAQYGMIEALKDLEIPQELTDIYRQRSEYTYKKLKGTGCNPIRSDGGFYIVLDCNDWIRKKNMESSKELAREILSETYVSVVPGTDFGIPNSLRLSFCNERYNEAVDRLHSYFLM